MVEGKPQFLSYILRPTLENIPRTIGLLIVLWFLGIPQTALVIGTILVLSILFFRRWRLWRREYYKITAKSVQWKRGTLFQRDETDIEREQLTVITSQQTYLQRVLFKTQTIRLQSAGRGGTSISLRDIPQDINLFAEPTPTEYETTPSASGVVLTGLQTLIRTGFNLALVGTGIFFLYQNLALSAIQTVQQSTNMASVIGVGLSLYILQQGIPIVDLLSRTYRINGNTVSKEGGRFTTVKQQVSRNSITDTTATQRFLERLVDLSTVIISCRGRTSSISLPYMAEPKTFLSYIETQEESQISFQTEPDRIRSALPIAAAIPFIIQFPALIILFAPSLYTLIKPLRTQYEIHDDGVQESYSLFQTGKEFFTFKDIAGIQKRRTPLDWLFSTYTVDIWSYGSSKPLVLQHISSNSFWLEIQEKFQVTDPSGPLWKENITVEGFLQTIIPYIFVISILGGLVSPVLIGVGLMLLLGYGVHEYYVSPTRTVQYGDTIVGTQEGLFPHKVYVKKETVQGVKETAYPFSQGSVQLLIPGYTRFAQNIPLLSRRTPLKLKYTVPKHIQQHVIPTSSWNQYKPNIKSEIASTAGPALLLYIGLSIASSALSTTLYSGWVTTTYLLYSTGRALLYRYAISDETVHKATGILWRTVITIPIPKIDHVETQKSWYNMLTETRTVLLFTKAEGQGDVALTSATDELEEAINERLNT